MKRLHEESIQRVVQYGSERQRGGAPAARPVYGTLADAGDIDGLAESLLRTKGWVITSAKADLLAAYPLDDPEVKELLQQRRALHDELVESQVIQMLHQQRLDQKGLGGAESVVMLPELTSQFEIQQQIDSLSAHARCRKRRMARSIGSHGKKLQQALPEDAVLLDYFFYELTAENRRNNSLWMPDCDQRTSGAFCFSGASGAGCRVVKSFAQWAAPNRIGISWSDASAASSVDCAGRTSVAPGNAQAIYMSG